MDAVFCKPVARYSGVLGVRLQRTGVGVLGGSIHLARSLGQDTFVFRMATGFHDRRTRRPLLSTPIVSPDQYPWPAQLSRRVQEIRAADGGDNSFLHSVIVERTRVWVGILLRRHRGSRGPLLRQAAVFLFIVVSCVLAWLYRRPTPVPRRTWCADGEIVAWTCDESEKSIVVASDAAISTGVQQSGLSLEARRFNRFRGFQGWSNTFQLDCSALGQPIGPVRWSKRWDVCRPIKQKKKGMCALVACTVAVEAMHRLEYEGRYGKGTFQWSAAEPHEQLLMACQSADPPIWEKGKGAKVPDVLKMMQALGREQLANPPSDARILVLPPSCWEVYTGDQVTRELVKEQLDVGPCVGTLWLCPWYRYFNASLDGGAWVYRGCGRTTEYRDYSEKLYPGNVGNHAVVCIGYRFWGDQMHVLVLDNHKPDGPLRWVGVEELVEFYPIKIDCLNPPTRKRKRPT